MILEPDYMNDLMFDTATHVYRVGGRIIPHITEIVLSDYSHVPPNVLETARQRGHAVHKTCELYDLGILNWHTLDPKLVPYLESWCKAINDYEIEFAPEDVERRLYHPIDKYAGTGDRPRAWIKPPNQPRRLAVIELKSIAKMSEEVGLQTAGQQRCENYRARALGIPETQDRWGIQLKSDGSYKAVQYTDRRHERVFLSFLTVLNWQVLTGKAKYAIQGVRSNGGRQ